MFLSIFQGHMVRVVTESDESDDSTNEEGEAAAEEEAAEEKIGAEAEEEEEENLEAEEEEDMTCNIKNKKIKSMVVKKRGAGEKEKSLTTRDMEKEKKMTTRLKMVESVSEGRQRMSTLIQGMNKRKTREKSLDLACRHSEEKMKKEKKILKSQPSQRPCNQCGGSVAEGESIAEEKKEIEIVRYNKEKKKLHMIGNEKMMKRDTEQEEVELEGDTEAGRILRQFIRTGYYLTGMCVCPHISFSFPLSRIYNLISFSLSPCEPVVKCDVSLYLSCLYRYL